MKNKRQEIGGRMTDLMKRYEAEVVVEKEIVE